MKKKKLKNYDDYTRHSNIYYTIFVLCSYDYTPAYAFETISSSRPLTRATIIIITPSGRLLLGSRFIDSFAYFGI